MTKFKVGDKVKYTAKYRNQFQDFNYRNKLRQSRGKIEYISLDKKMFWANMKREGDTVQAWYTQWALKKID